MKGHISFRAWLHDTAGVTVACYFVLQWLVAGVVSVSERLAGQKASRALGARGSVATMIVSVCLGMFISWAGWGR